MKEVNLSVSAVKTHEGARGWLIFSRGEIFYDLFLNDMSYPVCPGQFDNYRKRESFEL